MGLELVTRRDCHLCEEAEALLTAAEIEFTSRDVDADPELYRLYDFRVPVILLEGRVVAEGRIAREAIGRLTRT